MAEPGNIRMGEVIIAGKPLKCHDCGSTNMVVDPDGSCSHQKQCGDCGRGWVHVTSGSTMECACQRAGRI